MHYVSPFESLGMSDFDKIDKSSLNLAKKKMLADIELSNTHTILRGGKEMTKDDIIKTFDGLSNISDWDAHRLIAQDETLLAFLENHSLTEKSAFLKADAYLDESFIEFVSPYFSSSYKKVLLECLKKHNFQLLNKLVNGTPKLMTEWAKEETDAVLESWVNAKQEQIEDITDQVEKGVRFSDKEIEPLYELNLMKCLNVLPKDYTWLRDKYVLVLYNLSANVWNRFQRKRARKIAYNAVILKCSPYESDLIKERCRFFEDADSDSWIMIYFRMYHMTFFQKPAGFTLVLSWILKIIAAPIVLPFRLWTQFGEWAGNYWLGRVVIGIGNFFMGIWSLVFTIWLVVFLVSLLFLGLSKI
jgi:hypothetical protein